MLCLPPNFLKISILTDRRKCTVGTAHFASYVHIYFIFKLHQKTTPVKSYEVKISHALSKVSTKLFRSVTLALPETSATTYACVPVDSTRGCNLVYSIQFFFLSLCPEAQNLIWNSVSLLTVSQRPKEIKYEAGLYLECEHAFHFTSRENKIFNIPTQFATWGSFISK